jgi:putative thioredoxin
MTGEPLAPVAVPDVVLAANDDNFVEFLNLSATVPVIANVFSSTDLASRELTTTLDRLVRAMSGRLVLVNIDAKDSPEVVAAMQVRTLPTVVALIGGQLAPLFEGAQAEVTVANVLSQVLDAAAQNGVSGTAIVEMQSEESAEADEPLSPLHQDAFDAIERADYPAAISAYDRALVENPADELAIAGRAQVQLIARLQRKTMADIRARAAGEPQNLDAAFDVADLDLSGGHVEDACSRLLMLFVNAEPNDKTRIRERLLEYFVVVGATDPRVIAARTQLANLLF